MEKQTAVEWLINRIEEKGDARKTPYTTIIELYLDTPEYNELINKAKEMEKQQIIDAIIFSKREHYTLGECWPTQTVIDKAESYYKKTFKNK